jgi:hypothetical protein
MRWWRGPLNTRPTRFVGSYIVLAHWNNSPLIEMSPHPDILYFFRANQFLIFQINPACLWEKQRTHDLPLPRRTRWPLHPRCSCHYWTFPLLYTKCIHIPSICRDRNRIRIQIFTRVQKGRGVNVRHSLTTRFWTMDTPLLSGHLGAFNALSHIMLSLQ